ncbi:MAG TPA: zinc-dependent metalloprotease, partial [Candidatus Polarisedimenticolia bacterium]|nr:zinc-dependent metalloprotease [Candidatus Polarisedimenticolia bacterium]
RRESPYVRYVTRWNLQKEEPFAALSKPKEPITFWLENNIPKQYRKAVADGILVWNKAFERIGFKDAVVVKQQPDDADWDPADARYSTVRWFVTTTSSFAIGPSRINPWTGQIFDADIGVAEAIVRNTRYEFQELSDPVGVLRRIAESMYASVAPDGAPGDASAFAASSGGPLNCTLGTGIAQQAAFGYSLLAARGMQPGSEEEDRYVNDFITHVMAHEVGHTLGLRHNFRASQVQPFDQLQNTARTNQQGLTGSVMDYIPVNLAPSGGTQGQYWQTTLGDYDYWAIEYAYRTIPGVKTSEDELPELRKTATRVAEAGLHYGTDEDNSEPRTNMWDIGQDTLAYHRARVGLARELWSRIPTTLAKEGEGYQKIRRSFEAGLFELFPAAINVSKTIGGIHTHRDHVGDPQGRLPYEPVPAERQREALAFLRQNLFESDSFRLSSDLLNRLAASRWWDFDFSVFRMPRTEFPLHDTVLFMQQVTLNQLYSPIKLDRLQDLEMHYGAGQKPFTMAEMFNGLYESIWSEVGPSGSKSIDSFRRGLQRAHLEKLIGLLVRPLPGTPEDAGTMARANLVDLKGRIDATLRAGSGADALTRAHLEETRSRIEAALQAQMIRISG